MGRFEKRGLDMGERKKRGPPTEATKAKRHEKKRLAERQQNRDGFSHLFGKATATTTNTTSIPSSSYENDGIDGRSSTTSILGKSTATTTNTTSIPSSYRYFPKTASIFTYPLCVLEAQSASQGDSKECGSRTSYM
jgi:hypothetical protein